MALLTRHLPRGDDLDSRLGQLLLGLEIGCFALLRAFKARLSSYGHPLGLQKGCQRQHCLVYPRGRAPELPANCPTGNVDGQRKALL